MVILDTNTQSGCSGYPGYSLAYVALFVVDVCTIYATEKYSANYLHEYNKNKLCTINIYELNADANEWCRLLI